MRKIPGNHGFLSGISILVIALILAVIGGTLYYFNRVSTLPSVSELKQDPSPTVVSGDESEAKAFLEVLVDLVNSDQTVECTLESTDTTVATLSGTMYIANGKLRGDFRLNAQDSEIEGHIIRAGEWGYVWTSLHPQGTKIRHQANLERLLQFDTGERDGENALDQRVHYNCSPWSENEALFLPPQDVDFIDLTGKDGRD